MGEFHEYTGPTKSDSIQIGTRLQPHSPIEDLEQLG